MVGSWNINVSVNSMPQKVATAMGKINDYMVGAEYQPIAYLGSQVVNGTNHAVLAEQVVVTGRDTKNVVVMIFNEKPNEMDLTLVSIERVVEGGAPLGGVQVITETKIPTDAQDAWNAAFEDFVGSKVEPFALVGTQVVKGTDYIFAATVTPVAPDAVSKVVIVTVNGLTKTVTFADMLENKYQASLGYAFTWLKHGIACPLGEWP